MSKSVWIVIKTNEGNRGTIEGVYSTKDSAIQTVKSCGQKEQELRGPEWEDTFTYRDGNGIGPDYIVSNVTNGINSIQYTARTYFVNN